VAWGFFSLCIQLCKNVHQEKQVWEVFLSPVFSHTLFYLLWRALPVCVHDVFLA
jgi:hypothetical protein